MDLLMKFKFKIISLVLMLSLNILLGCGGGDSSVAQTDSVDGQGGSMARFSIIGDFLYTISGRNLNLYSLKNNPAEPTQFNTVTVDWGIETLYSSGNYLFMGAENGVYIFDNIDPSNPRQISKFLHVRSYDPVVVSGKYAYVTLRSGAGRFRGINQMDVLKMTDFKNPVLVKSYAMQNPKGLGVGNGLLFVCDDIAGLKTYSIAEPSNPQFVATDASINCYDLIPYSKNSANTISGDNQVSASTNNLLISDTSGILQFEYDNTGLTKVSEINISK